MVENIVVGLISAIVALYLKYSYDNIKEEKELQCNIYSFNRTIMDVYYPRLKEMNSLYDEALKIIEESESNELSMPYSYLKAPLFDLYDKQFFVKISKTKNLPYHYFFELSVLLQDLKEENYVTVIRDYHKMNYDTLSMSNSHFVDLKSEMNDYIASGILVIQEENYRKSKTIALIKIELINERMIKIDRIITEIITKLEE
ncbi:hypothetical protein [Myroides fluvii]|uniref:hypothetical protein n=1 Tax=Myroides fluvii TaxID=2572594 RepID=UPI00131B7C18|nr:hypothetical protein [Myroides fluvii]